MKFLLIMLIPLAIPFIARAVWQHKICWKEFGLHVGIMLVLTALLFFAGRYSATYDTETWSGQVVKKEQVRVSCEHSYRCNCVTTTDSKGYSTTICQTCYEHSNDWDWRVFASYDDYVNIQRVDRRGSKEPPRWTEVRVGDPMSANFSFTNYIKAAPDSLFNEQPLVSGLPVPSYPDRIYDYYKVDRALSVGAKVNTRKWSDEISLMMRNLGPQAKANVIVVFAKTADTRFAEDLRQAWLGGKKNDVILVMGVDSEEKLLWTRVVSWSENKMIHTDLRDRVQAFAGSPLHPEDVLPIVDDSVRKNFRRMIEENYEYLADEIEPPLWALIASFLIALAASCGLTYWFHKEEVF